MTCRPVALLGPLGHGKSALLNKLCGTRHASGAGAGSCTTSLEYGQNKDHNLFVIGTPGFGSKDDVAAHIAAQKLALEGVALCGVYAVVKCSRANDIENQVENLMDFLGSDDVRIVITHADIWQDESGFSELELRSTVAKNLDIPVKHIILVGKSTPGNVIASFIAGTLHDPKTFEITDIQTAAISSLSGIRKFNVPINTALAKIKVALEICSSIVRTEGKNYETDLVIIATQNTTRSMVAEAKDSIFRTAFEQLHSTQDQNLVYGKAGTHLSLALQNFLVATNKVLSWDVSDATDSRNIYKKCPHCDAVYAKVSGCPDLQACGEAANVPPPEVAKQTKHIDAKFEGGSNGEPWSVRFVFNGVYEKVDSLIVSIRNFSSPFQQQEQHDTEALDQAEANGTRELNIYCGKKTNWNEMIPISATDLALLGKVDFDIEGEMEEQSKNLFTTNIDTHYANNLDILKKGLNEMKL